MENQLARFSVTEIKAMVYDELAKAEQAQANIRILNQELRNRLQPQQNNAVTPDNGVPTITSANFSDAPDA